MNYKYRMNKEIEDIDDFSHLKHKALKKALLAKYKILRKFIG